MLSHPHRFLPLASQLLAATLCAQSAGGGDGEVDRGPASPSPLAALLGTGSGSEGPPPTILRFNAEYVGRSSLGDGGATASFTQVGLLAEIPVASVGPVSGSLGLGVEDRRYGFRDFGTFIPDVSDPLNNSLAARVAPNLSFGLNGRWQFFAGGSWLYTGAYGSAVSDATMWGGGAGAIYQVTTNLTLVGGFSFSERLDATTLYVPIFGFNWQINDRWTAVAGDVATTINGPTLGLQISYSLGERWKLFGLAGYEDTFTRLGDAGALSDGTFRYRSGAALLGGEWQIIPAFALRLYVGSNIAQEYTFRNSGRVQLGSARSGNSLATGLVGRVMF